MVLTGAFFGTNPAIVNVTYGTVSAPNLFACTVITVIDTQILCRTTAGAGANFVFVGVYFCFALSVCGSLILRFPF